MATAGLWAATLALAQVRPALATPSGGTVRVLAAAPAHPQTVLLGTATGAVFRSINAGRNWKFFGHIGDHEDWVVSALVPDRTRAGHWYASLWSWTAHNGGVFASGNGGKTWHPLWLGHAVRALAIAPSDAHILVAAALDGVFRSEDRGGHWDRISPAHDRELENVESVAIAPRNPQDIYVGTWHLPWKTIDGGHDWWQMRQGVIDDSDVFSIAVDRVDPSTIYLSACSGIYRSDDRGNQFRKIEGIPYSARRTLALVQDSVHPGTIYAGTTQGLWVSRDQGATWRRITSPRLSINSVVALPHRLLLGTNFAGVIASSNDGQSFQPSNDGFSSRHVAAVTSAPDGRYLSITGDQAWGGVFWQPRDGGWQQLPALPQRAQATGLHWSAAGLLAATDHGVFLLPAPGQPPPPILRRGAADRGRQANGSRHWVQRTGMPASPIYALASAAPRSLQVWAAGQRGLYRSRDGGWQWVLQRNAPAPLYHVLAQRGRHGEVRLWVAGDGYVVRSQDGGRHFLSGRLSLDGAERARINQLALMPVTGGHAELLAATTAGLYTSSDWGLHWLRSGHGLPAVNVTSIHVQKDGLYVFASSVGTTFRSSDGGAHWQAVHLLPAVEAEARLAPMLPLRLTPDAVDARISSTVNRSKLNH